MSTVELIAVEVEPAANTGPRSGARREVVARTAAARGFLIQLIAREIQLLDRSATWLAAAGRELGREWGERPELSDGCDRLADQTAVLREQLRVLMHHLVAHWNRSEQRCGRRLHGRRLHVATLLEQPITGAFAELVELHERIVAGPTPWLELAVLRPIEQMLAGVVPLAIDVAAVDDGDLAEAAELFGAREQRARELATLLVNIIAADARRSAAVAELEEQAIATFTKLLAECAKTGRELDGRRHYLLVR